ncbi:MAG: NTP transferase domain-containing protein, partial [Candidatus Omnitrophota bacterium]
MRKSPLAVVILAAGKGTRMRSALPKALTPLCGRPLIGYLLEAARRLGAARTVVVAGYGFDEVRRAASGAVVVRQSQLLGSG